MIIVTSIALGAIILTALLGLAWFFRSGSLADRIVSLDMLLSTAVVGIAVYSARIDNGVYLDVLLVTSLVAFVGTVTVARYIERRGT